MISIILYGRNDNYGYNLHKRAALSLNCMAEMLNSASDEILFVDYNTPDDFPTFPEAIQDTLTRRAKEILRIFRVRPRVHERFKSTTHLLALESIARNVAIRRSCEANRWILSTNTDMIFVPLRERSLSEIARDLPPGFYHAPRIEIPEVLWESLDRSDPADVIKTVREWGSSLHLNEIVLGSKLILYDGPGDFQLILRSDLFEHHGFDESMLLGWHVDSNMAARMQLKYGQVGDLGREIFGYHCDHTRQVTPAHSHSRVQNDWRRFVAEVAQPEIPEQADIWGCANDPIEELQLANRSAKLYVQALREAIGRPLAEAKVVQYTGQTYNKVDYDPRHVVPFLADMFASMPRSINVAWYGSREEMLNLFARVWENLGFSGKILVDQALQLAHAASPTVSARSSTQALTDAGAFIFDFGGVSSPTSTAGRPIGDLHRGFLQVVRAERHRLLHGAAPRRIIALNAINNEHEGFVCGLVAAAATPFATHMRHGFVLPPLMAAESWLGQLGIGEAGVRVGDEIRNVTTKRGWIAYGPYKHLDEGTYRVSLKIGLLDPDNQKPPKSEPCLFVEVRAGADLLALNLLRCGDLIVADHSFEFAIPSEIANGREGVETRIAVMAPVAIVVRELNVQRVSASTEVDHKVPAVLRLEDWLPFLRLGELGRMSEHGVIAKTGPGDYVVYGPYWTLPPGNYELVGSVVPLAPDAEGKPVITIDVSSDGGQRRFAEHQWYVGHSESAKIELRLPFTMATDLPSSLRTIETRIFTSGEGIFQMRSLTVKLRNPTAERDWFAYLAIGECGIHTGREIKGIAGRRGYMARTPVMHVERGRYKLSTDAGAVGDRLHVGLEVLSGSELIAIGTVGTDQPLEFDVTEEAAQTGVKLRLRTITAAVVSIRSLLVERMSDSAAPSLGPPILQLDDWLPFLESKPIAHAQEDGILVGEGEPQYAVYGPYWLLPPGDYELICSVNPLAPSSDGKPLITIDVSTEAGQRRFAEQQWHLGHFQSSEAHKAVELRLPFTLAADLSPALRTIETRIFTSGDRSFRVRSLAIKPRSPKRGQDWFAHLAIGESGVHTDREIKSIAGKRGYIASTPVLQVEPGQYTLGADVGAVGDPAYVGLEIWSGTQLIAIGTAGTDRPLKFDVTKEAAHTGVKLRLRAVTAAVVSIRSLVVQRTSTSAAPSLMPPALQLDDWVPFLRTAPGVHVEEDGIVVDKGPPGYVVYGPYWTLPPGDYELSCSVAPLAPDPDGKPLITIDVSTEAGQRRFAEQQWHVGHFQFGEAHTAGELRLPFTLAADLPPALRTIETRIFSTGDGSLRVRSLTVHRISDPLEQSAKSVIADFDVHRILRVVSYHAKLKVPKKLRAALVAIKSILRN